MRFLVQPLTGNSMSHPAFSFNQSKNYSLAPHNSGLAATVVNGFLEQHPWTAATTQQWRFERVTGTDYFRIISATDSNNNKLVDVQGESQADMANLIVATRRDEAWSQQWQVIYLGGSRFRLQNRHSNKVWDVYYRGETPGTRIIQHSWNGGDNPHQQFRVNEVIDLDATAGYGGTITLFSGTSFSGQGLTLGLGSHDLVELGWNDVPRSVRVPRGLRVTMFEHLDGTGLLKELTSDSSALGEMNGIASKVNVELVAWFHEHEYYGGKNISLGIGNYRYHDLTDRGLSNDTMSSVRVPAGLQVILFQDNNFLGNRRVLMSDTPRLEGFNDEVSSVQIKAIGTIIPASALRFGDTIVLRSWRDMNLTASPGGDARNDQQTTGDTARFKVYRAGGTTTLDYVCYGDVIALRRVDGQYLSRNQDDRIRLNASSVGQHERFAVMRYGGETQSDTFISKGDSLALFAMQAEKFVSGDDDGSVRARVEWTREWEAWTVQTILREGVPLKDGEPFEVPYADYRAVRERRGPAISYKDLMALRAADKAMMDALCGANICPADNCGVQSCQAQVCGADACAAALCGANQEVVKVCGAATNVLAICGADVAFVAACAIEATLAALCGANFCGVDGCAIAGCAADACGVASCAAAGCAAAGCGAAGCGVQACSLDGCGGNGCAGDACAIATCPVAACGGQACGGNGCTIAVAPCAVDACGANACLVNLCPIDACAADACLIDLIPIVPFI